jgi:hypothetical protein
MKLPLSALLSFNAGYVDAVGYLALEGLFTAHVTGNFVTVAAELVFGTSGVVTKLSALPVFLRGRRAYALCELRIACGRPKHANGSDDPQVHAAFAGCRPRNSLGSIHRPSLSERVGDRHDPGSGDGNSERD